MNKKLIERQIITFFERPTFLFKFSLFLKAVLKSPLNKAKLFDTFMDLFLKLKGIKLTEKTTGIILESKRSFHFLINKLIIQV